MSLIGLVGHYLSVLKVPLNFLKLLLKLVWFYPKSDMASCRVSKWDSDFESDVEEESPTDTEDLDDRTLEFLGWFTPLGYRMLSSITGMENDHLKVYVRASLLNPANSTFENIETYFNNSQCHDFKMQLNRIVKIHRYDDCKDEYGSHNLKLLWHGTKKDNVGNILINGFCLPEHKGQMFGSGVYFADRVSKSAQYCDGTKMGNKGYIFLCAVNLGRIQMSTSALNHYKEAPSCYDSVMGVGKFVPDESECRYHRRYKIPCGKTVSSPLKLTLPLNYNEYIIYNLNRIFVKFIIEFEIV